MDVHTFSLRASFMCASVPFFRQLTIRGVGGARQGAADAHLPGLHRQPAGHGCQAHGGRRAHGLHQSGPVPSLLPPVSHEPQGGAGPAAVRARPAADHQGHAHLRAGVQQRDLPGASKGFSPPPQTQLLPLAELHAAYHHLCLRPLPSLRRGLACLSCEWLKGSVGRFHREDREAALIRRM